MRVVILNPGLRAKFWRPFCSFSGSTCMNAPFFWNDNTSRGFRKVIYFFPGGLPWWHITLWMWVNTGIIRYFARWGDFEEKVERQWKGDQNTCNEPNYSEKIVLGPWQCLLRRKSFFKTQNFKNKLYLTPFLLVGCCLLKMGSNKVDFSKFWVLKNDFLLNKDCYGPKAIFSE